MSGYPPKLTVKADAVDRQPWAINIGNVVGIVEGDCKTFEAHDRCARTGRYANLARKLKIAAATSQAPIATWRSMNGEGKRNVAARLIEPVLRAGYDARRKGNKTQDRPRATMPDPPTSRPSGPTSEKPMIQPLPARRPTPPAP